ncbi:hypothetical protein NDU88_002631 [Pleurodeles waltl]|uniref:Uncharacterized protein n=1 Tax=Pleurodeles waltl TaxID=8319 RepID=A0AAV7UCY0_PLEWA|nr:hypothetical protein NDU88_002631 [Pleurodeles waltl]
MVTPAPGTLPAIPGGMACMEDAQGGVKVKTGSRQHPKGASVEKKKPRKKDKQAKAGTDCKKRSHSSSTPTSDETAHNQKSWKQPPKAAPSEPVDKGSCTKKASRRTAKKDERKALSSSSSSASSSHPVQELSDQINESLRWEGVLDDPLAEEERIRQYKANRRRRYLLAANSGSMMAARIAQEAVENRCSQEHRPQLVADEDCHRLYTRKDTSNAYFLGPLGEAALKAEAGTKLTPLKSPSLGKISQEVI